MRSQRQQAVWCHVAPLLLVLLLGGCVSAPQTALLLEQEKAQPAMALVSPVLLDSVPFHAQEAYQCGPASLAMMLGASGLTMAPDALVPLVYVPDRKGSFQAEMLAATRSSGRLAYELSPSLEALLAEVAAGRPVLVLQNLGLSWYEKWHYAVVKGFDIERRQLILNSGTLENREVPLKTFERTWARSGHWAMVVATPGEVPTTADASHYFNAVVALEKANPAKVVGKAYSAGLMRWPDDRMLLMGYANLRYAEKDLPVAAALYQQVIDHHPAYAPAYNNLAQAQLEMGEWNAARSNANKAVELGGEYVDTYRDTLKDIIAARQDR